MKKVLVFVAVIAMVLSMSLSAFATGFAPSVENKPAPPIDNIVDGSGKEALGAIRDSNGKIVGYLYDECLVITPVSEIENSDDIPQAAKDLLLDLYKKLTSGEMKLPYEKYNPEMNAGNMVIRDLFDISMLCKDHPEMLKQPGNTLELTFKLGVAAGVEVVTMVYVDGQWKPISSTKNNGDGTVTCVFDAIGPVSFSVRADVHTDKPEKTGDISSMPWVILGGCALLALVAVTVVYRSSMKKREA